MTVGFNYLGKLGQLECQVGIPCGRLFRLYCWRRETRPALDDRSRSGVAWAFANRTTPSVETIHCGESALLVAGFYS